MKPIAVGDLVQVVRGMECCGQITGAEGMIFRVTEIEGGIGVCKWCMAPLSRAAHGCPARKAITFGRLKRIPPLDELEGVKSEEKLKESV